MIHKKIDYRRRILEISIKRLAQIVNVHPKTLARFLHGKKTRITLREVLRITKFLGLKVEIVCP